MSASVDIVNQDSNPSTTPSATKGVMSNLRLVSFGTFLSRVLGLLRDITMTSLFGAGTVLDAFIVAFRLPNLSRQLLGEGALSTAFLPVFLRSREQHGEVAARETLTLVAILLAAVLTGIIALAEIGIAIAWQTMDLSESSRLLLGLLSVMLPYALVICLAALFCAALHAQRQFFWPTLVPLVLNLIWLAGVLQVRTWDQTPAKQAYFLAACVTAAGFVQMLIPYFALRSQGLGLISSWRRGWPNVREILSAIIPVLIGMSILQAGATIDSFVAWGLAKPDDNSVAWCQMLNIEPVLEAGTASAIYLGQRLLQFPLGVFGIALGTVLFPILTQHAQRGEIQLLRADLSRGLRFVLAIGIPASAGLCIISWPVTIALFQHGQFDERDAFLTSRMIGIYSAGVWSMIGIAVLNRAWYATGDRMTPMRLGLAALVLNQILNFSLIWTFGGVALAIGSVLSSGVLCLVTLFKLNRHIGPLDWRSINRTLIKSLICTVAMTAICLVVQSWLPAPVSFLSKVNLLGTSCLTGGVVYLAVSRLIGMTEFEELLTRQ